MKRLLLLFLLIPFLGITQRYQDALLYGKKENRLIVLSGLGLPRDTIILNDTAKLYPHIAYRNDSIWIWNPSKQRWNKFAQGSGDQVDVFLVAGQSNARGNGDSSLSPNPMPGTVYQFDNSVFEQVTNEVGHLPGARGSIWPTFGINYNILSGNKICFVPEGVDGSGQITLSDIGFGHWGTSGTLFPRSVLQIDSAMQAILDDGKIPVFKGILWSQGENDARKINASTETKSQYRLGLDTMVMNYRLLYGPKMPFYIFQTGTETVTSDVGYKDIRDAQQEFVDFNPLINKFASKNAIDFPARSLLQLDGLHYLQGGYNDLGTVGPENILSGMDRRWERSGTNLIYAGGRVGVGIRSPLYPFHVLTTTGDLAKFSGNGNGLASLWLENTNSGSSAGDAIRFSNNSGFGAQIAYGSSANAFTPNGLLMHPFTGDFWIGANGGNIYFFTGATGPLLANIKAIINQAGAFGLGSTPVASAILDIGGTTRGVLLPRMNTTQMNAISSPATSLIIYNTDSSFFMYYNGSAWTSMVGTSGGGSGVLQSVITDTLQNYWRLTGNNGIAGASTGSFLGTLNNLSLRFRSNNIQRLVLDSSGRFDFGIVTDRNAWDGQLSTISIKQTNNDIMGGMTFTPNANDVTHLSIGAGGIASDQTFGFISLGGNIYFNTTHIKVGDNGAGTARIHIAAGSTSLAPEKNTSGSLLTTPEVGAKEYDNSFYETNNALNRYGKGGVISSNSTIVANSSTSITTLNSYTTKANTLDANEQVLKANYTGKYNDAAGVETMVISFGGTSIMNIAPAGNTTGWRIDVSIIRTGSSTATATVFYMDDNEIHSNIVTHLTGLTFSSTNILLLTGTSSNATTNAINKETARIYWEPQPSN